MTSKEQALYAIMEEQGYSHGLCVTALRILSQSKAAMDDAMIYIDDTHPSEDELVHYLAEICK